jgi:hypothetical protein
MRKPRLLVAAACCSAVLSTLPIDAQINTSTIAGVVTDETGGGVPNARVSATVPLRTLAAGVLIG